MRENGKTNREGQERRTEKKKAEEGKREIIIRLREAKLKQAEKARRAFKNPTKRKTVCCTKESFLKDLIIFVIKKI